MYFVLAPQAILFCMLEAVLNHGFAVVTYLFKVLLGTPPTFGFVSVFGSTPSGQLKLNGLEVPIILKKSLELVSSDPLSSSNPFSHDMP